MKFDFYGKRFICFIISGVIILAGLISIAVNGLKMDIQFKGGTIIQMKMKDGDFDEKEAGELIAELTGRSVIPQKSKVYDPDNEGDSPYLLSLNIAKSDSALTGEQISEIEDVIIQKYGLEPAGAVAGEINVEPFIGREIRDNGVKALIILSILTVIYLAIRFAAISGLSAGIMAIVALIHDALIMLSVYAIFRVPVNELFIAAMLTIIGYSINDTVVIYDRIRENIKTSRKLSYPEIANNSLNQNLVRTINTGLAVFVSLVIILVFSLIYDIGSLSSFSFPLIIGSVSGTYSSLFIATPLWVMWRESQKKKRAEKKPARA